MRDGPASEHNNASFTVERSMDMQDWAAVITLAGAGNSQSVLNYASMDASPLPRTSYYRLRQTDFDGASTVSDIVPVSFEDAVGTLNVFPNPAQDLVTAIYDAEDGMAKLSVFNELGQAMTLPVQAKAGRRRHRCVHVARWRLRRDAHHQRQCDHPAAARPALINRSAPQQAPTTQAGLARRRSSVAR